MHNTSAYATFYGGGSVVIRINGTDDDADDGDTVWPLHVRSLAQFVFNESHLPAFFNASGLADDDPRVTRAHFRPYVAAGDDPTFHPSVVTAPYTVNVTNVDDDTAGILLAQAPSDAAPNGFDRRVYKAAARQPSDRGYTKFGRSRRRPSARCLAVARSGDDDASCSF